MSENHVSKPLSTGNSNSSQTIQTIQTNQTLQCSDKNLSFLSKKEEEKGERSREKAENLSPQNPAPHSHAVSTSNSPITEQDWVAEEKFPVQNSQVSTEVKESGKGKNLETRIKEQVKFGLAEKEQVNENLTSKLKPLSESLAKPKSCSQDKTIPQETPSDRTGFNDSQIPAEIKAKLEELNIPLDSKVSKAIDSYHISQVKGAIAHIENTWESIKNPRGVFLFQIPRQPVNREQERRSRLPVILVVILSNT